MLGPPCSGESRWTRVSAGVREGDWTHEGTIHVSGVGARWHTGGYSQGRENRIQLSAIARASVVSAPYPGARSRWPSRARRGALPNSSPANRGSAGRGPTVGPNDSRGLARAPTGQRAPALSEMFMCPQLLGMSNCAPALGVRRCHWVCAGLQCDTDVVVQFYTATSDAHSPLGL